MVRPRSEYTGRAGGELNERAAIRLHLFSNTTDRALELLFDESIYTLCSLILLQPALSLVLGLLLVPLLLLCQRPRLIQQLLL